MNVTEDTADLEWGPSEHDGGTPILQYAVEIRESRRTMWGRAGVVDANTTRYVARNLVIDNEYYFRIRAINAEGESQPLEGEESVIPRKKKGILFHYFGVFLQFCNFIYILFHFFCVFTVL